MKLSSMSAAALLLVTLTSHAQDALTVITFGGVSGATVKKHMVEPFQAQSGKSILLDSYSGGIAEMKAQVQSNQIGWDVVSVEALDLERACSEGLLEVIDHSLLPAGIDGTPAQADFIVGALDSECGVASLVFAVVFAYNQNSFGTLLPESISDLFDLQTFPGKRALQKRPQVTMEWALMADGVPKNKVYQVLATEQGQTRAFNKLDSIKSQIVWFDSWSQAPQLLNDGGAVMAQAANGRFYNAAVHEGKPFVIVWDGMVYDMDVWTIVKGTPRRELALEFILHATGSKPLSGMADIAYGPTRKSSNQVLPEAIKPHLPTTYLDLGLKGNSAFWADYGETLSERFNEWMLKK